MRTLDAKGGNISAVGCHTQALKLEDRIEAPDGGSEKDKGCLIQQVSDDAYANE